MKFENKTIIGRLESIELPEFNITDLDVRVDTGAKTSSLHVDNLVKSTINGQPYVTFDLHPDSYNVEKIVKCEAPISDIRNVKSSNGKAEQRYVIQTLAKLGTLEWLIEITLTDRSDMSYLMLLGREALGSQFLVDPSKSFLGASK
ncbi:ATP-dependent zinc protease [Leucothrix sargassi]|nr:ATP-dependent zinc protease [Leucothrix sargassi]